MIKIFIVEDDLQLRLLYEKVLKQEGFDIVDTAINGLEAIEKFNNFVVKPDIILMDYMMPIKDGLEAMKEILAVDDKTKIVIMSADRDIKKQALGNGAIGFINKPFSFRYVSSYMKKLIKSQKERKDLIRKNPFKSNLDYCF